MVLQCQDLFGNASFEGYSDAQAMIDGNPWLTGERVTVQDVLPQLNLEVVHEKTDHNSWFHCVSRKVFAAPQHDQSTSLFLSPFDYSDIDRGARKEVVGWLQENIRDKSFFDQHLLRTHLDDLGYDTVDDYLSDMKERGTWADHVALEGTAQVYGFEIFGLDARSPELGLRLLASPRSEVTTSPLNVLYNGTHYDTLINTAPETLDQNASSNPSSSLPTSTKAPPPPVSSKGTGLLVF